MRWVIQVERNLGNILKIYQRLESRASVRFELRKKYPPPRRAFLGQMYYSKGTLYSRRDTDTFSLSLWHLRPKFHSQQTIDHPYPQLRNLNMKSKREGSI